MYVYIYIIYIYIIYLHILKHIKTPLTVPGKVMASVLLQRLKDTVDEQLRQEQAGFMKGRSIFNLLQIIEKVTAWKKPTPYKLHRLQAGV